MGVGSVAGEVTIPFSNKWDSLSKILKHDLGGRVIGCPDAKMRATVLRLRLAAYSEGAVKRTGGFAGTIWRMRLRHSA
jgi:hypothetical protein